MTGNTGPCDRHLRMEPSPAPSSCGSTFIGRRSSYCDLGGHANWRIKATRCLFSWTTHQMWCGNDVNSARCWAICGSSRWSASPLSSEAPHQTQGPLQGFHYTGWGNVISEHRLKEHILKTLMPLCVQTEGWSYFNMTLCSLENSIGLHVTVNLFYFIYSSHDWQRSWGSFL